MLNESERIELKRIFWSGTFGNPSREIAVMVDSWDENKVKSEIARVRQDEIEKLARQEAYIQKRKKELGV